MWVFVHVKRGQQILSFHVSKATVYSTPTHSANTPPDAPPRSFAALGTFISSSPPRILSLVHQVCLYYCVHLNRTPPSHSFFAPWYKTTWLMWKILWLGILGYRLNRTHIHTLNFCKLGRMHMLNHWRTKLLQIRTYSLMAEGDDEITRETRNLQTTALSKNMPQHTHTHMRVRTHTRTDTNTHTGKPTVAASFVFPYPFFHLIIVDCHFDHS